MPTVQIDAEPGPITNDSLVTFQFSSNTSNVDFFCQLTGEGRVPLSSSIGTLSARKTSHLKDCCEYSREGPASFTYHSLLYMQQNPPPKKGCKVAPAADSFPNAGDSTWNESEPQPCFTPAQYNGLPDGRYTFSLTGIDRAGNLADPEESDFLLDTTPPRISHINFPQGSQSGNFTLTFVADDGDGSGIGAVACKCVQSLLPKPGMTAETVNFYCTISTAYQQQTLFSSCICTELCVSSVQSESCFPDSA